MAVPDAILTGGVAYAAAALAVVKRAAPESQSWLDALKGFGSQAGGAVRGQFNQLKDQFGQLPAEARHGLTGAGIGAAVGGLGGALSGRFGPRDRSPWRSGLTGALAGAGIGGGLGVALPSLVRTLQDEPLTEQITEENRREQAAQPIIQQLVSRGKELVVGAPAAPGQSIPEITERGWDRLKENTGDTVGKTLADAPAAVVGGANRILPTVGTIAGGAGGHMSHVHAQNTALEKVFREGSLKMPGRVPGSVTQPTEVLRGQMAGRSPHAAGRIVADAIAEDTPHDAIRFLRSAKPAGPRLAAIEDALEMAGHVRPGRLGSTIRHAGRIGAGSLAGLATGLLAEQAFGAPTVSETGRQTGQFFNNIYGRMPSMPPTYNSQFHP